MLTLTRNTRVLIDPDTGLGSVITPDQQVWTLNRSAVLAMGELANGGSVSEAEAAIARRWPTVPIDQVRADLDALIKEMEQAGAVMQQ